MNKGVLASLLLIGALAAPVTFTTRAVAQENRQQQVRNEDQKKDQKTQERNTPQEQKYQSWNGDYRYEETVDRDWLNQQQRNTQQRKQYRSWDTDYRYEETVDRNWLKEHNLH